MGSINLYRSISLILLLIVVFLGGRSLVSHDSAGEEPGSEFAAPDIGANQAVRVHLAEAKIADLPLRIAATGKTRARRQIILKSRVNGVVLACPAFEGKEVKRGELLVQIDTTDYALQYRQAEYELTTATIDYGTKLGEHAYASRRGATGPQLLDSTAAAKAFRAARRAFADGKISKNTLQLSERQYAAAKIFTETDKHTLLALSSGLSAAMIQAEIARQNLRHTRIAAPLAATAGDVRIQQNQLVSAGDELLTLVDLRSIYVDVDILENEAATIGRGSQARVQISAFPDTVFQGEIVALNPIIDAEKKTRRVTVLMQNPAQKVLAGMFVAVQLDVEILHNRLLVPREAIVLRDNRPVVFIARENTAGELRAVWSYVDIGQQNAQFVEIKSSKFNLQPGESVVIDNHYTMIHDAKIRAIED